MALLAWAGKQPGKRPGKRPGKPWRITQTSPFVSKFSHPVLPPYSPAFYSTCSTDDPYQTWQHPTCNKRWCWWALTGRCSSSFPSSAPVRSCLIHVLIHVITHSNLVLALFGKETTPPANLKGAGASCSVGTQYMYGSVVFVIRIITAGLRRYTAVPTLHHANSKTYHQLGGICICSCSAPSRASSSVSVPETDYICITRSTIYHAGREKKRKEDCEAVRFILVMMDAYQLANFIDPIHIKPLEPTPI